MRGRGVPVYSVVRGIDDGLVVWLNGLARCSPLRARVVAVVAERLAIVEVGLMCLLAVTGRRGSAVRMLAAVGLVYVASEGLGIAWPRLRPFARLDQVEGLAPHTPRRSFPSRHVASGLAMAAFGGRLHVLMAVVAWLLGISRVAAGLHYPSDVLAGAVLGVVVGRYARKA